MAERWDCPPNRSTQPLQSPIANRQIAFPNPQSNVFCYHACEGASAQKFEDEIHARTGAKTELPKEISASWETRENAEYQAAKERQRLVESRISMLQKRGSARLR